MRSILYPEKFRENIKSYFIKVVDNKGIAINIEKSIFNYSIKLAGKKNIVKKWENPYFVEIYINKLKTIYINLKDKVLLNKIIQKEILGQDLAFMTHQNLMPEKWEELIKNKTNTDSLLRPGSAFVL